MTSDRSERWPLRSPCGRRRCESQASSTSAEAISAASTGQLTSSTSPSTKPPVTRQAVARELRLQRRQSFSNRDAIRQAVIASVTVTDADLDRYLDRHGGNIRVLERRDLRLVLTKTRAAALAARRDLVAGAKWSAVTRRYSIDEATRAHGGRLPSQVKGTLERRLDRAVFRAQLHRVVGPVRTRFGWYVFWVSRIRPAGEHSRGWSRRYVRPVVLGNAQQRTLDRWVTDFQDRWRSRTICVPSYAKYPQCAPVG